MDQSSSSRVRLAPVAEQDLNVENFIKDIFDSHFIWNCQGPKTEVHWSVIALKHNFSVEFLKRKWTGLRNSFRNELKKIPRNGKNEYMEDPRSFPSRWPYYRSMLFLVDRIRLQPIAEIPVNVNTAASSSSNSIGIAGYKRRNIDYVDVENDDDFETFNTTPFNSAKKSRYKDMANDHEKQIKNAADMESDNVIEKATENLPKNNSQLSVRSVAEEIEVTPDVFEIPNFKPSGSDSDYFFLMSLHEFMEKVNPLRKLYVRALIQNILYEELLTHD